MLDRNPPHSLQSTFLKSAYTRTSLGMEDRDVLHWLQEQNEAVHVRVRRTMFSKLDKRAYDEQHKSIRHESGKFFSIDGIHVRTNWGYKAEWEQPIINLPEVGYLGCLVKEFDVVLDTMQSKEGGRFFEEQNRNMIVILPDEPDTGASAAIPYHKELYGELPENYIWMTLQQLAVFMTFNNYLNIQSRSLIAAIPFI
mgnify:CR=1 FL=1